MSGPTHDRPPTIDPIAARRWDGRLAASSPWLHEEVARRMEDRLQWIRLTPTAWAHWAPVRGGLQAHALVAKRYPASDCFVVEARAEAAQAAMKFIAKPLWSPARWTGGKTRFSAPPDGAVQMLQEGSVAAGRFQYAAVVVSQAQHGADDRLRGEHLAEARYVGRKGGQRLSGGG